MDEADRSVLAQALGMKDREIVSAEEGPGGLVVTTFDGQTVQLEQPPADVPNGLAPQALGTAGDESAGGRAEPEGTAEEQPPDEPVEAVPEGSAKTILAWVGTDLDRAGAALAAERARPQPRTTLIAELEKL